jgi:hypothetical protein
MTHAVETTLLNNKEVFVLNVDANLTLPGF